MLEARGLTKRYAGTLAVNEVSFVLNPGEVSGYLGPNGSGKTTTVKMLTGLLEPTQGDIFFEGRNIKENLIEYKRRLGYVPEEPFLYPFLTGPEYLQLVGRLRSIPERLLASKIDGFMQLFSLQVHRHSAISTYSKGMRQKILIAAALLHDPDLIIFDEPLSGLDVASAMVFRSLVHLLARQGKTILFGSHVLETVEKLCSTVIILHRGNIVANDSVENLRDLMKLPSLEEIFAQLVQQENTEEIASQIAQVVKLGP